MCLFMQANVQTSVQVVSPKNIHSHNEKDDLQQSDLLYLINPHFHCHIKLIHLDEIKREESSGNGPLHTASSIIFFYRLGPSK